MISPFTYCRPIEESFTIEVRQISVVSIAALMFVVDSADSGLHGALQLGTLVHLTLVVERAARQARHLQ